MWKKFKHWLIKKLGGYIVSPTKEIVVNHYTKELTTLSRTLKIDNRTLRNHPKMVDALYNSAVEELVQELRKSQCIEKEICDYPSMDGVVVKLSIRAAQAINPLPTSIEQNEEEWEQIMKENKSDYFYDYMGYAQQGGFRKEIIYSTNPAID